MSNNGAFYNVDELAEYLGMSKDGIYKLAQQGRIPAAKVGRHWRFKRNIIDEWLQKQQGTNYKKSIKNILVVDDEQDILDMFFYMFEKEKYRILLAGNGIQSSIEAGAMKPDLIILDVMMQQINGYDLCKEFKNNEKTSSIPILLMTGKDKYQVQEKFKEVGANDFILKPFSPSALIEKVNLLLEI